MATKVKLVADGVVTADQLTLTTAATGTNTTAPATTAFVQQEVAALVDSAPGTLNTLNELAAALGDDANFSTTVTNSIATKLPLAGGTLTGRLDISHSNFDMLRLHQTDANGGFIKFTNTDDTDGWFTGIAGTEKYIISRTADNTTPIITIEQNGEVGIGTDNPATLLDISGTTPTLTISDSQNKSWTSSDTIYGKVSFKTLDDSGIGAHESAYIGVHADVSSSTTPGGRLVFGTSNANAAAAETMTLDGNGFLGLGTSNPSALLTMTGNSDTSDESCLIIINDEDTDVGSQVPAIQFRGNDSNIGRIRANGVLGLILSGSSAQGDDLVVQSNTVMVGTTESNPTSSGVNTVGLSFSTTGGIRSTVASNPAATFNRKTDNGSVVIIRKDGNTLGVLGTEGGDSFYVGSGDTGLKFSDPSNAIQPFNTNTESATNNTIDLGTSGAVFSNLWIEKINISGNSNDEGIYFSSNHRIYGGSNRAFEAATSSGGSVQLGEGYTTGDVFISAPELQYPEDLRFKDDNGILRFTKTVSVGESATTVLTITKSSYSYFIGGTITFILVDTGSPWGIRTQTYSISGRVATYQAGDNMGVAYSLIKESANMDYTPTLSTVDTRTTGQNGGTYEFKFANGSGNGSSNCKVIFDGYFAGGALS
jgi:hypothetical protein